MAKDPAFLFYPGDYLRDTQCLSESVQVAYDRIMCEHMRNICISREQLNFFTKRLSDPEKSELMHVLTEVEGGYQITWVAESIDKRRAYSDSRRKNRSSERKDMKHISSTYVSHMENEIENEDVIEIVNETAGEKPKRAKFQKPDYPEVLQFMKNANAVAGGRWTEVKVVTEAKNYFNYYEANGWRVGRNPMKDWNAACRKWMNNADNFNNNGTRQKQSDELDAFRKHNANRVGQALGIVSSGDGNGSS